MRFQLAPEIDSLVVPADLIFASQRIAQKDSLLWGEGTEASIRLGWVDLHETSRSLLPALDALTARMRDEGFTEIILSGMGGSSLAPEVIARSYGPSASRRLTLLDSTHPENVAAILGRDLAKAFFVISSKSGTTIETNSHVAAIRNCLKDQGLDPRKHLLVITDPGSPLEALADAEGWPRIAGDSKVGGRFSALSPFGLVPTALLGIDPSILLDDAAEMATMIHEPACKLALYLMKERFVFFEDVSSKTPGLSDWVEQLIAESTGKFGKGLLPIALNGSRPGVIKLHMDLAKAIDAPLGAQFLLWEWVTALLGYLLKVDPFDQPDVQATKTKTAEALSDIATLDPREGTVTIKDAMLQLEQELAGREYIAICAYLDPIEHRDVMRLQGLLAARFKVPVSFGWGPRFLHSTGQFHKGGPRCGVFLSITSETTKRSEIPGRAFDFQGLILAQAQGDRVALEERGNPVIRLHLEEPVREIAELLASAN